MEPLIAQLPIVYALPDDGQSLFDLLNLGGMNHKTIIQGSPKAYTEKIKLSSINSMKLPIRSYIRCIKSEFLNVTQLAKQKIFANKSDWNYLEIETDLSLF